MNGSKEPWTNVPNKIMNPILQSALGSILRWALMLFAAFLVKHGIWSDSDAGKYVEAGVVALLTLGLSLWQKYKSRVKFLTALMPVAVGGPQTEAEVDAHIARGAPTPSLTTPVNTVPGVPGAPAAPSNPSVLTSPGDLKQKTTVP